MQGQPFLENLAHPARGVAELPRRNPGGAMEGAHEIGEIAKAHVERDVGDGPAISGQHTGRVTQTRAHQILVRRNPEYAREQPEEVEWADISLPRRPVQIDLLMRMGVNPQRSFDRTAPVPGGRSNRLARAA